VRKLTLTFDNGPVAETTPSVLDLLDRFGIKAHFYLVGNRLADPQLFDLAAQTREQGHLIGNHTMTHTVPLGRTRDPEHVRNEIISAQEALGTLVGEIKLFRPYGGGGTLGPHLLSAAAAEHLRSNNYTVVGWNVVPRDWELPPDSWVDRAIPMTETEEWPVVVLHDRPGTAMKYLERFLVSMIERGFEFTQDVAPSCVLIADREIRPAARGLIAA
jgi:peptidoglycan-N-acetylglucosamine deacetylase